MCDEMMVSFTDKINNGHITEMYERQREHYPAGHAGNTAQQSGETGNLLPIPDHCSCITQVQQVVTG